METLRTRADGSTIKSAKHVSPAKADPNSKRSARKRARNYKPEVSRPNRRAIRRLSIASNGNSDGSTTKPGAQKRW